MGLPITTLGIATNSNDILARTLASGRYETGAVSATISPSMDIQVSSNFERLVFDAVGRDAEVLRALMASLRQSGSFTLPPSALAYIRNGFMAGRTGEAETADTIARLLRVSGYLLDPHTAVGVAVAETIRGGQSPVVTLATAHPAKFPAAVKAASGIEPGLPAWLSDLYERRERCTVLDNSQDEVEAFILDRTRALEERN
jgi:threonine synthase